LRISLKNNKGQFMYPNGSKRLSARHVARVCLLLTLLPLINNCSSDKTALKPPPENPIELRVENNSLSVIDVIQAKPCGANEDQYKPQMNGIKPKERIMLHIYEECVDLVALDGFGNVMDELVGLRLNSHITWKIQ
jgi:hypothetical protein